LTAYRKLQASRQGVFVIIGATMSEQQAPYNTGSPEADEEEWDAP